MSSRSSISSTSNCPSDTELEAYLEDLPEERPDDVSVVSQHLSQCARCRERAEEIRNDNELVAAVGNAHARPTVVAGSVSSDFSSLSIPGYEIQSEIQRGGQGIVLRAIQRATKRTVALKVLLRGAFASVRQQQRFEREIDLAAGLQHPNIVTVFDSGAASDGSHYYAMEYIEGVSLGQYMQAKHNSQTSDNPGSVNEALKLFSKICDAVHYAHQRGVIHRDLKPSNIRIDRNGEPHILDFGLAKVADPTEAADASFRTLTGEFMGTLAYASPEQTKIDPHLIDVRTDVYSLGVILYEMLTNHLPYRVKGPMAEVLKSIAEVDPEPPSSWYRRSVREKTQSIDAPFKINNEIETIVLKSLTKEKERRYQSIEHFRQDVEHYLKGEPIDAKRDSTWYVFQKTVRRHKTRFSMLILFAVMAMGYPVLHSRGLAQELDTANRYVADVIRLVEHSNPAKGKGANPGAITILDEHSVRLDTDPPRHPRHEAIQRIALGYAYKEYRRFDEAERELQIAQQLLEENTEEPSQDLADALNKLGDVYWFKSRYAEAESLYQRSLEMLENHFPDSKEAISENINDMAAVKLRLGDLDASEMFYRRALQMRRDLEFVDFPDKEQLIAESTNNLATCLLSKGKHADAANLYRESLDLYRALDLGEEPQSAWVMTGLAESLMYLEQFEEAERLHQEAFEIKQRALGRENESVAQSLHFLAEARYMHGDLEAAQAVCSEALALRKNEKILPLGHPSIAESLSLQGRILAAMEKHEDARTVFGEALAVVRAALSDDHYLTAEAEGELGECLVTLKEYEKAEALLKKSLDRLRNVLGDEHPSTQQAFKRMEGLYQALGKPDEAARYANLLSKRE